MEFIRELPAAAVLSADGEQFSIKDHEGRQRHGYHVSISEPGHETVICNVSGELLERALGHDATLNSERAIHLFPEASKLFARHPESRKLSFTAHVKAAHYQYLENTGQTERHCKVVVHGKHTSKSFTGSDRDETLKKALGWMENLDEATLHIKVEDKPITTRRTVIKEVYAGRKNLTHVEVELHLEYLTEVDGWIVLPPGI